MDATSNASATPDGILIDDAPAYDALVALEGVARPRYLGRGDWRDWAESVAGELQVDQWRRVRAWFADSSVGLALLSLVPLLTDARDLAALSDALEALPLGDVARIAVTAELMAPQGPLDADDLLALRGDAAAARRFCDHYLHVRGRGRTAMIRLLVAPDEARDELVATLRQFDAQVFTPLAPRLRAERERAADAVRAQVERAGGAAPAYITERDHLEGFTPIVIGLSTLLGDGLSLYYHDIDRTLIDGRDYEPFVAVVGARKALALGARRRGGSLADGSERFADPASRWATLYGALADPSRLRIVRLLAERPRYGQELAAELGMSGATISHHLTALSKAGALRMERSAHRTYFVLDQESLRGLLRQGEQYALGAPTLPAEDGTPQDTRESSDTQEGMA
ncbi:MAG TPA: metalloregulator ArsR/SmtB family transcription factor [Ktedonobacterales bacterium]|nr:metalloregulator ArsR/SmtB family transcription factor [Ktedonobacterales bacterium]